jgi:hypothetical protein
MYPVQKSVWVGKQGPRDRCVAHRIRKRGLARGSARARGSNAARVAGQRLGPRGQRRRRSPESAAPRAAADTSAGAAGAAGAADNTGGRAGHQSSHDGVGRALRDEPRARGAAAARVSRAFCSRSCYCARRCAAHPRRVADHLCAPAQALADDARRDGRNVPRGRRQPHPRLCAAARHRGDDRAAVQRDLYPSADAPARGRVRARDHRGQPPRRAAPDVRAAARPPWRHLGAPQRRKRDCRLGARDRCRARPEPAAAARSAASAAHSRTRGPHSTKSPIEAAPCTPLSAAAAATTAAAATAATTTLSTAAPAAAAVAPRLARRRPDDPWAVSVAPDASCAGDGAQFRGHGCSESSRRGCSECRGECRLGCQEQDGVLDVVNLGQWRAGQQRARAAVECGARGAFCARRCGRALCIDALADPAATGGDNGLGQAKGRQGFCVDAAPGASGDSVVVDPPWVVDAVDDVVDDVVANIAAHNVPAAEAGRGGGRRPARRGAVRVRHRGAWRLHIRMLRPDRHRIAHAALAGLGALGIPRQGHRAL